MQAADVLVDADVAVFDELGIHHFEDVDDPLARDAMRRVVRVVGLRESRIGALAVPFFITTAV